MAKKKKTAQLRIYLFPHRIKKFISNTIPLNSIHKPSDLTYNCTRRILSCQSKKTLLNECFQIKLTELLLSLMVNLSFS